jgi:hypothetical protein
MVKAPKLIKSGKPAKAIPYAKLVSLFGKRTDDPAVLAVLKQAGEAEIEDDFIIAKDAGFDFSLAEAPRAKRKDPKLLSGLFLFPEGGDDHRGYTGLPDNFAWVPRAELHARVGPPESSQDTLDDDVPVDDPEVYQDTWTVGGLRFVVAYRKGVARHVFVDAPDELIAREISTHPLHFEAKPVDAPPDADLVGMALLVAWAIEREGLSEKHAKTPLGTQVAKREITPREFLVQACAKTLSTDDVAPQLADFLWGYTHRMFRRAANKAITKLLHLGRADELAYTDDFLGTFKHAVKSPFYVPDSWDAVDRIAPVLDARWAGYQATKFTSPPSVALYEKAAKLRDKQAVTPARAEVAKAAIDDELANDLVASIGRSLKDPAVKAVLARANMPVGKVIDQQANPALGVAYMGSKFAIGGTRELGVDAVWFFARKQSSYIRGLGEEVEFAGYPGPLPHGLAFGDSRAQVAKKLGKPTSSYEKQDYWRPKKNRRLTCTFKSDKLVQIFIGQPDEDE